MLDSETELQITISKPVDDYVHNVPTEEFPKWRIKSNPHKSKCFKCFKTVKSAVLNLSRGVPSRLRLQPSLKWTFIFLYRFWFQRDSSISRWLLWYLLLTHAHTQGHTHTVKRWKQHQPQAVTAGIKHWGRSWFTYWPRLIIKSLQRPVKHCGLS